MTTFKLTSSVDGENPVVHDLHLENGQLVLLDGTDAIRQNILTRLLFFRGEGFLDQREGVPYFGSVFLKAPDMEAVRGIFRQAIDGTPGVSKVQSLILDLNRSTRELSVRFEAVADTGEVIRVGFEKPFLIEV